MPKRQGKHLDRVVDLLSACVAYPINDALARSLLDRTSSLKAASLALTPRQVRRVNNRIEKLHERLGAPPEFIIYLTRNGPPKYNTFAETALGEIISSFDRSRRAVCRAHVCSLAAMIYKEQPHLLTRVPPERIHGEIVALVQEQLWEHVETAYIRLAAFWDRVGQLLNFVFFNIRQSERDGFSVVADRIRLNYVPMSPELSSSRSWKAIRAYMDSEKKTGLKWLLRRRNLLIHSLQLPSIEIRTHDSPLFVPEYDHLREKIRSKLAPGPASDELHQLHVHLGSAARLFEHILGLCEIGVRLRAKFLVDDRTRDIGLKKWGDG